MAHQSAAHRLGRWLATFVGSLILGVVLAAPRWVPEWQRYVDGIVVGLLIASAVAGIASFNAGRHRFGQRVASGLRYLAYLFFAGLMCALWSIGALIAAVVMSGAPFGETYDKQFHFAEIDATIYLYDSSFIDPETTVYLRRGWLPLREQVTRLGKTPDAVEVTLRGSLLVIDDLTLDLRNHE